MGWLTRGVVGVLLAAGALAAIRADQLRGDDEAWGQVFGSGLGSRVGPGVRSSISPLAEQRSFSMIVANHEPRQFHLDFCFAYFAYFADA